MVWVAGDEAISEKLDQTAWEEIKEIIVAGIKRGKVARGLRDGIRRAGELLREHFPGTEEDVDELNDAPRFVD